MNHATGVVRLFAFDHAEFQHRHAVSLASKDPASRGRHHVLILDNPTGFIEVDERAALAQDDQTEGVDPLPIH